MKKLYTIHQFQRDQRLIEAARRLGTEYSEDTLKHKKEALKAYGYKNLNVKDGRQPIDTIQHPGRITHAFANTVEDAQKRMAQHEAYCAQPETIDTVLYKLSHADDSDQRDALKERFCIMTEYLPNDHPTIIAYQKLAQ